MNQRASGGTTKGSRKSQILPLPLLHRHVRLSRDACQHCKFLFNHARNYEAHTAVRRVSQRTGRRCAGKDRPCSACGPQPRARRPPASCPQVSTSIGSSKEARLSLLLVSLACWRMKFMSKIETLQRQPGCGPKADLKSQLGILTCAVS